MQLIGKLPAVVAAWIAGLCQLLMTQTHLCRGNAVVQWTEILLQRDANQLLAIYISVRLTSL
jgi:hypothetical protein